MFRYVANSLTKIGAKKDVLYAKPLFKKNFVLIF